jgi:hypothetical protein
MSQMVLAALVAAFLGLAGARRLGLFGIVIASVAVATGAGLLADGGVVLRLVAAVAVVFVFHVATVAGLLLEYNRGPRVPKAWPALSRRA